MRNKDKPKRVKRLVAQKNAKKYGKGLKIKKAAWKFIRDHARVIEEGKLFVKFIVIDESNFWDRVLARKNGYQSESDYRKEESKIHQAFKVKKFSDNMSRRNDLIAKAIERGDDEEMKAKLKLYRELKKEIFGYEKKRGKHIADNQIVVSECTQENVCVGDQTDGHEVNTVSQS